MIRHASRQTHQNPRPEPLFRAPAWQWLRFGEVRWWVRPEWSDTLIGPDGLRLDEWREGGRLAVIKTGPQRVVYRVDLPGGAVFVKHNLVPSWREMLRQWFRRGKSRNEGHRALKLAGIGVPTITPIALGEQRKRKFLFENYLVSPAIPDTVALDEFVEEHLPLMEASRRAKIRQALAFSLGELTAYLHQAGFVHQDFHPGNLLLRLDEQDRPKLSMIDLDALRVRRNLNWKDARENLALLNHYFWTRSERSDRMRFLKTYLDARTGERPDLATFAESIEKATRSWAERLWRRWGKRCRSDNKYFARFRTDRAKGVASRDLDPQAVQALMEDPEAPFRDERTTILKSSRTTTVAEIVLPVEGRDTKVIYKRFNRKKRLDPILNLFRPSRGWRAWQNGQHLDCRGVPTPKNLLVIERGATGRRFLPHHFLPHETYLATVKAEPSITLNDYKDDVFPTLSPDRQRGAIRRVLPSLAALIRMMHDRSLSHRDLKAANILLVGALEAPRPCLQLIDLVGVSLDAPIPRRKRVQNLARLQVSLASTPGRTRTDGLRFLWAYAPGLRHDRPKWKRLWREIERACQSKALQNERRGRVLS